MSQQHMFENEYGAQALERGYAGEDDFAERYRPAERYEQKVFPGGAASQKITPKHRLTLAIVSVCVLIPVVALLLTSGISNDNAGDFIIIAGRTIALALTCLTIMVVNIAFSRGQH